MKAILRKQKVRVASAAAWSCKKSSGNDKAYGLWGVVPCVWIYALIYGNAIVVKKLYIRISGIEYIKETVL